VVLDGANIAHGGANGSGLDGRRVISAISEYKSKGYEVITVFKKETYNFMAKNKKPGFNKLKRLKEKNEMTLFKKNDDHLAIVLAIKHNAWLITPRHFRNYKEPDGTHCSYVQAKGDPLINFHQNTCRIQNQTTYSQVA
jgi:hypothetical protein